MASAKRSRQRTQSGREKVQSARNLVEFAVDRLGSHEPSSDLKVAVGRKLRYRRNHRGLAGVSAGMATRIEKGDMAPSILTRVSIADVLEVLTPMFFHGLNRRPSVNVVPARKGPGTDRGGTRHRA